MKPAVDLFNTNLKTRLHQICLNQLAEKIERLSGLINDAQMAATDDAKSSAGDKFETSREMMKLEINKYSTQLSNYVKMVQNLHKINLKTKQNQVTFGSLVKTNEGIYYFSVSLGKLLVDEQACYALSMASPIGKALVDKKAGERVSFLGREIRIEEIG